MKTNYSEQLKSPKWQKKRLEIMQRDVFKCVLCMNEDDTLAVHHKKYIIGREVWDYDNEYLITLCQKCHEKMHGIQNTVKDVVTLPAPNMVELNKHQLRLLEYINKWNYGTQNTEIYDILCELLVIDYQNMSVIKSIIKVHADCNKIFKSICDILKYTCDKLYENEPNMPIKPVTTFSIKGKK